MKHPLIKWPLAQGLTEFWNWRSYLWGSDGNRMRLWIGLAVLTLTLAIGVPSQIAASTQVNPQVILVSLDGMNPTLVKKFLQEGVLKADRGIGLLRQVGVSAEQNVTVLPSLTAASHIAIGTGSTAARNNINANSFHLVASPFTSNISGFGAPIGGYTLTDSVASESTDPTAESLWVALRQQGKQVIAATFPGADGVDIKVPGITNSSIIQSAQRRTVDFTVPFGAFAGVGSRGFNLTQADFTAAPETIVSQLQAAGKVSYSSVQQRVMPETFTVGGVTYTIQAAAIDTTNDNIINYDTLVFYDVAQGIKPGPFSLPATGPAYVKAADQKSRRFYLEGSATKAGTGFYVSQLAPNLSTVRFARYSANFIPSTPAIQENVDAINTSVGFWAPQPDFRIPQRLSPGFDQFPDLELEAIYEDLVRTFVNYQTRVALEALKRNPNADLALFYIEQPDGSGHQFSLVDPRQASDFTNPNSIGEGQDLDKVERYQRYVQFSYQVADRAVQRLIQAVGTDRRGRPNRNFIVVSDHGMSPFHTAINLNAYLTSMGFPAAKVRAVTSGPAVNVYINLQGREPNGTVTAAEYVTLKSQIAIALQALRDNNPNYVLKPTLTGKAVFAQVATRPDDAPLGLATTELIGQDAGDVFAVLTSGYNFDGTQSPVVFRKGDVETTTAPIFSVPSFYGAHGYDPTLKQMSAVFYAAGPDIGKGKLAKVRTIDVAPTILKLLGVKPSAKVQGQALDLGT